MMFSYSGKKRYKKQSSEPKWYKAAEKCSYKLKSKAPKHSEEDSGKPVLNRS